MQPLPRRIRAGIAGAGRYGRRRAEALVSLPDRVELVGVVDPVAERAARLARETGAAAFSALGVLLDQVEVLCIAAPTLDHFILAQAAARAGVHVFVEWPPAVSVRECEALGRLTEEAGIEVGVSRPLRFHPALAARPPAWRADLVVLRQDLADGQAEARAAWPVYLADAVDLCSVLAGSQSLQRIDAERVQGPGLFPEAAAFSLRFHSGTYAQAMFRFHAPAPSASLYLAGPGLQIETDLAGCEVRVSRTGGKAPGENAPPESAFRQKTGAPPDLLRTELVAFLHAVGEKTPAPVSILDGLNTLRLMERVQAKLR